MPMKPSFYFRLPSTFSRLSLPFKGRVGVRMGLVQSRGAPPSSSLASPAGEAY
ncbi:hypothetical protein [Geomonas sp.]|uniref:hypothetical protein n=1 Tax=Geomonas sp. TaxID=2651584 RepID=UPI002B47AD2D|nr:hypothetical protein [Geomonas sp.]HJV34216.1 hypothetical protein [Geomonas sp.]